MKLPFVDIEKFAHFTMKNIEEQIKFKQDTVTEFVGQLDKLIEGRDEFKIIERNKLVSDIKHFASLLSCAGSF